MISQQELLSLFYPIIKEKGFRSIKKALIKAKRAEAGVWITTTTSSGITSRNQAKKGDFLIENQTSSHELYLMGSETFDQKYQIEQCLEKGWASYRPKSFVLSYQIQTSDFDLLGSVESVVYESPIEKEALLHPGDFLIIPLVGTEIYGVGAKEFEQTYRQV